MCLRGGGTVRANFNYLVQVVVLVKEIVGGARFSIDVMAVTSQGVRGGVAWTVLEK